MSYFSVDHNYIDNLNLTLLAGRNFPDNMSAKNENFIILNEKATKELNFESVHDAIGEQIYLGKKDSTMAQIIGVVKDYSYRMLLMDLKPMGLRYKPGQFQYANVKIKGDAPEVTIEGLETEWKKLDKNHAFDFEFFEAQLEDSYGFVKDLRSIISVTAILTIIIASLGLLGMAIYNVESRSKEVGIRKVMGADITNIIVQLSKGFLLLIALSILIATPLAYFANNLWLQEIATRITVGPAILTTGILILLGIGALTVGSQSVRAAFANPANSLKDE
jgi:putative ABC transport system permease protein